MVPPLSSDKDESYWLGVRDALRMIDSFVAWSRRNPNRAKKIDDFIDDALIAVNRHCKSCLSQALGISFGESEGEEAVADFGDRKGGHVQGARSEFSSSRRAAPSGKYPRDTAEPMDEEPLAPPDLVEEMRDAAFYSEPPLSEMPDMSRMGLSSQKRSPPEQTHEETVRDFLSEFPLEEPTSLETEGSQNGKPLRAPASKEPSPVSTESEEGVRNREDKTKGSAEDRLPDAWSDFEDSFYEHGADIGLPKVLDESELSEWDSTKKIHEESPEGFSWEEYERTISSPPLPEEPKVSTRPADSATSKSPSVWSPYDEQGEEEPKVTDRGSDEIEEDEGDEDESEEDITRPTVRPPPPPPRPESEESEEERKKRARRLFFGT